MLKRFLLIVIGILVVAALVGAYFYFRNPFSVTVNSGRNQKVIAFIRRPQEHADWVLSAGTTCGDAPFQMPTTGFIGYLWGDSFRLGHTHQGIDIFAGTEAGVTPIYAAYAGYLTRLPEWKSTVIVRIPDDPLQPGRQIWTYYTHIADQQGNSFIDAQFPPGTYEVFIEAGTLLGYQGNYSGTPGNPTGIHLHFSIVKDDGSGSFLNELEIDNTIDPSAYFGMNLNAWNNNGDVPVCLSSF